MSEKMHRAVWLTLVVLFVMTSVGVAIYSFWSNTHSNKNSDVISCSHTGNPPNQQSQNGKVIGAKLADYKGPQKFTFLKCNDFKVGTGATVTTGSTVTVIYVGALASDGTIFDSSVDNGQPVSFRLSQVIPGWSDGLQGMKVGGLRRIFIPSQYGYGSQSVSGIPANSDLVFDVSLMAVN